MSQLFFGLDSKVWNNFTHMERMDFLTGRIAIAMGNGGVREAVQEMESFIFHDAFDAGYESGVKSAKQEIAAAVRDERTKLKTKAKNVRKGIKRMKKGSKR